MSTLTKAVSAQWPIAVEFEALFSDDMLDTSGVSFIFETITAGTVFPICTPPPGAVVLGGTIYNVAAATGPTAASLDVGDTDDPDRYTPTIHNRLSATAHTDMTPVGAVAKVYSGNQSINGTLINSVAADTTGKFRVVIVMAAAGKATENLKTT